jgi:TusA-related sulfurtransferase
MRPKPCFPQQTGKTFDLYQSDSPGPGLNYPRMKGEWQDETKPGAMAGESGEPVKWVDVDARGLEPPQPMVKILEALGQLPRTAALRAHTDRRPMHLYTMLEQRGYAGQSEAQADGSFITLIRPIA